MIDKGANGVSGGVIATDASAGKFEALIHLKTDFQTYPAIKIFSPPSLYPALQAHQFQMHPRLIQQFLTQVNDTFLALVACPPAQESHS